MFTVCPKCTLTLVVTTVDLRAGQGYVRCGRCANVFNALVALREGDPNGGISDTANRRLQQTAPPASMTPALGAGVAMDPEPEPEPEPPPQPEPEPTPDPEEISLEFDAAATDVSEIFISPEEIEQAGSGSFEAVVLAEESPVEVPDEPEAELAPEPEDDPSHTDTIAASEWSLLDDDPPADDESVIEESPLTAEAAEEAAAAMDEEPLAEEVPADSEPASDPAWVDEMFAEAEAEAERARTAEHAALVEDETPEAEIEAAQSSNDAVASSDAALEPLLTEPEVQRPSWQYVAAVAGLTLALLVQVVHFNRQSLVLNTAIGPAVSTVYGWFNVTLTPRWDLTAYTVKQLGAEAEGGEGSRLRVRLSLQNESDRVQPLPLLRLTLQDRFGNAVATRDLEPSDYLPPRATELRLLEPDQRIDAELHVVDPGRAASSFEIDACLRGDGGAIGCANDVPRSTAG